MKLQSCIAFALGMTLLSPVIAQTSTPTFENVLQFNRSQARVTAHFQFGNDGRLYGASSNPRVIWSVKPGETSIVVHDNPNQIEVLNGTSIARSSTGAFYKGAFPTDSAGALTVSNCPYNYTLRVNDEPVVFEKFGSVFKFGPGLAPEKLPVSESQPVCPTGGLGVDPGDNQYFVSKIDSVALVANASAVGTRLYRIAADGSTMVAIHEFTDGATPGPLHSSRDGQWLFGLNEGTVSLASYLYRIRPDGTAFQKLHEFSSTTGAPAASNGHLIEVGDYVYGTASAGGGVCTIPGLGDFAAGCGSVYRVKSDGTEVLTVLHSFQYSDGRNPLGRLALGGDGNIYGTTSEGGSATVGAIFRIKPAEISGPGTGFEGNLHQFSGVDTSDGRAPVGLVAGRDGKLYGAASGNPRHRVYALNIGYVPPGPVINLVATPAQVAWVNGLGQPTTLTWTADGAVSCTASGDWIGAKGISGSESVTPVREGESTYTLSCDNGSGLSDAVSTQTIRVQAVAPPPAPNLTLTSSASSVPMGSSVTLSWEAANALSCAATGDWSGSKALDSEGKGSEAITLPVTDAAASRSYTLSCTGAGGSVSQTVSVATTIPPGEQTGMSVGGGGGSASGGLLAVLAALAALMRCAPRSARSSAGRSQISVRPPAVN